MEVGGYGTRGWFQFQSVQEWVREGHWYHLGYHVLMSCGTGLSYKPRVINLEFASWGGRKERDSCDLGVKN